MYRPPPLIGVFQRLFTPCFGAFRTVAITLSNGLFTVWTFPRRFQPHFWIVTAIVKNGLRVVLGLVRVGGVLSHRRNAPFKVQTSATLTQSARFPGPGHSGQAQVILDIDTETGSRLEIGTFTLCNL